MTAAGPTTRPTNGAIEAADRLRAAEVGQRPCAPVRDLIGATDIGVAYEVQRILTSERLSSGARLIGRKVGLTSRAVQIQFGVDQPDFGVLFDFMKADEGRPIAMTTLLQPRAEAEIAFVLGADIVDLAVTAQSIAHAVEVAIPAIEIVDSRIAEWDIAITDTVADNASSGMFVLGAAQLDLARFVPAVVQMTMTIDDQLVSTGDGRACLGDPLEALAWLARTSITVGDPLRAGDIVLSGALGPVVPVPAGCTVRAEFTELGSVTATFTSESA